MDFTPLGGLGGALQGFGGLPGQNRSFALLQACFVFLLANPGALVLSKEADFKLFPLQKRL